MSVLKTRELLVDVARQLFAKNGFESTSMNDIALAANKGRRTLYTYFNSKEEIYLASADWMPRNLDRRVEILFPILDRGIAEKVTHIPT